MCLRDLPSLIKKYELFEAKIGENCLPSWTHVKSIIVVHVMGFKVVAFILEFRRSDNT